MRRFPFNPFPVKEVQSPWRLTVGEARRRQEVAMWNAANDVPLTHKVYTDSYVWCDHHCEIHEAKENPYTEDMSGLDSECNAQVWRSVFIESSDPEETF